MLTCIVAEGPEISTLQLDIDDNGRYQMPQCVHPRVVSLTSLEASRSFKTADSQLAETDKR